MARKNTGTVLQVNTSATTTASWTAVAELIDITAGDLTRDRIDVTHLGTTSQTRAFIGGFIELGELTMTGNYNPSNATHSGATNGLAGLFTAGSTKAWRILPQGNTSEANGFSGYVAAFTPRYSPDDQMLFDASIQLTTLPTFTT